MLRIYICIYTHACIHEEGNTIATVVVPLGDSLPEGGTNTCRRRRCVCHYIVCVARVSVNQHERTCNSHTHSHTQHTHTIHTHTHTHIYTQTHTRTHTHTHTHVRRTKSHTRATVSNYNCINVMCL